MYHNIRKWIFFILITSYSILVFADEPLPKPQTFSIYSDNKTFRIESNYSLDKVFCYRNEGKTEILEWEAKGYSNNIFVSDDGLYLVKGYFGLNLLALDYQKTDIVLSIYKNGILMKNILFNEVISNFGKLKRTVSHYFWGSILGIKNKEIYIETVEGHVIINLDNYNIIKYK